MINTCLAAAPGAADEGAGRARASLFSCNICRKCSSRTLSMNSSCSCRSSAIKVHTRDQTKDKDKEPGVLLWHRYHHSTTTSHKEGGGGRTCFSLSSGGTVPCLKATTTRSSPLPNDWASNPTLSAASYLFDAWNEWVIHYTRKDHWCGCRCKDTHHGARTSCTPTCGLAPGTGGRSGTYLQPAPPFAGLIGLVDHRDAFSQLLQPRVGSCVC